MDCDLSPLTVSERPAEFLLPLAADLAIKPGLH
jgi:hypothetical protein